MGLFTTFLLFDRYVVHPKTNQSMRIDFVYNGLNINNIDKIRAAES